MPVIGSSLSTVSKGTTKKTTFRSFPFIFAMRSDASIAMGLTPLPDCSDPLQTLLFARLFSYERFQSRARPPLQSRPMLACRSSFSISLQKCRSYA